LQETDRLEYAFQYDRLEQFASIPEQKKTLNWSSELLQIIFREKKYHNIIKRLYHAEIQSNEAMIFPMIFL